MIKIIEIGILFCAIISYGYLFQLENDKILTEKIEAELNSKNKKQLIFQKLPILNGIV
jgi:hypothetical protein